MRSKPKETTPSFVSAARKRLPSIAAALLLALLSAYLLAPAEAEEPGIGIARALGWHRGDPVPCVSVKPGEFHSYATDSEWGEFYVTRRGNFLFPPGTNFPPQENEDSENPTARLCSVVPGPSRIEEF